MLGRDLSDSSSFASRRSGPVAGSGGRRHVEAMLLGEQGRGVGIATERGLLSPVGESPLLVESDYVGAVGIHHEDLVVPKKVTREGDAFSVR